MSSPIFTPSQPTPLSPEAVLNAAYFSAVGFEDPSISPRRGGYGLKAERLLSVMGMALDIPGTDVFIDQLITVDLGSSPQAQVEALAQLANRRSDATYLVAGFVIAEKLPIEPKLCALSKLMEGSGVLMPDEGIARLDALVDDTNHHKRYLEANLALRADRLEILERATSMAERYGQLGERVTCAAAEGYVYGTGFVGVFTEGTVGRCLERTAGFLAVGQGAEPALIVDDEPLPSIPSILPLL